ncbi:peptidoglycan editing factor PgeF [Sanguibacter sp. 4.1]|uniref:Purine nucleoside phosphorylase n=1 Tax=Sanguibacter biliveldensis TaxID=3030830 RepID=A0AAF0Z607_9MICO|nr:peptidoglycan editing factor PgeF [Sanguibacter sp. 4.1]WPF80976.1 peptidoglycan editing factor PgeF [Sanguibacter sp. 4.1]
MQHAPQIPVLEVDLGPGIRAFFTTRAGGVSRAPWASLNVGTAVGDDPAHVSRNRERVDQAAGARVTFVSQVHGRSVAVLPASDGPGVPSAPALDASTEADALVSRVVDAPVGVYVADCVPVLLADPSSGVVAAVHAGRPGVELGVLGEAVRAMVATGADIASIRAAVGPSVCGRCYEVPADLRERVAAAVPATWATTGWGTPGLDLPRGVLAQLADAGVTQVVHVDRCTRTDDAFFSHRRASADGLATGRFAGVVGARRSQT